MTGENPHANQSREKLKYAVLPHVFRKTPKPAAPQSSHVLSPRTPYITRESERENGGPLRSEGYPLVVLHERRAMVE